MSVNLSESLLTLASGFDKSTPDTKVEAALIEFCKTQGFKVNAAAATKVLAGDDGKRFFLIYFESTIEAIRFASKTYRTTFGHNGVMIEVI